MSFAQLFMMSMTFVAEAVRGKVVTGKNFDSQKNTVNSPIQAC